MKTIGASHCEEIASLPVEQAMEMSDEADCRYCGTKLEKQDRICPECGSLVVSGSRNGSMN